MNKDGVGVLQKAGCSQEQRSDSYTIAFSQTAQGYQELEAQATIL